jgi:hypothetical protein
MLQLAAVGDFGVDNANELKVSARPRPARPMHQPIQHQHDTNSRESNNAMRVADQ